MYEFGRKRALLSAILVELQALNKGIKHMTVEMDELKAKIAAETEQDGKVVILLDTIRTRLDALVAQGTIDPADIKALSDQIGANTDTLAAAVARDSDKPPATT